jgi:hypothetical protein
MIGATMKDYERRAYKAAKEKVKEIERNAAKKLKDSDNVLQKKD